MTTAVLITGTSSGIGRATAQRLSHHPDLTVYATARRTEAIADLAEAGACILALDVTDEKSMRAAVDAPCDSRRSRSGSRSVSSSSA